MILSTKGPKFFCKYTPMARPEVYREYAVRVRKPVSYRDWTRVVGGFSEMIIDKMIECRDGVALPHRLGVIYIASTQTPAAHKERTATKYKLSNELGRIILEPNLHTGGFMCKIMYTIPAEDRNLREQGIWSFVAAANVKDKVSKEYMKDWQRYKILERFEKSRDNMKRYNKRFIENKIPRDKYDPLEK